ncbi:Ig-like domain-containing protein, partial [Actinoplanes siamensis]
MRRTAAAVLLIWAVVLGTCALLAGGGQAAAAGFALRFEANTNGSILLRGNANLVCPSIAIGCPAGRDGAGSRLDDNDFAMVNADADQDSGTVNDSTATVALPPGSTVLFAGLYWSANTTAGSLGTAARAADDQDRVRLKTPAGGGWQWVTATTVYGTGTPYQGFADVTGLVAGAGSGVYGVADIQAGTGVDRFAGWALAVAYRNPAEVLRALRVYDGLATVSSGSLDIAVSGFETPHSGSVRAEVGTVAYEGDLGKRGDALGLNGQPMSDAANPVDNFFNSTVSGGGAPVGGRAPGYANLFGVDIDQLDATDKLGHAVTSATLTLTTSGDTYYPGVVTFAIDLYAPKLVTTVTGTDLNGGDLLPGDVVEYRIEVRNEGNDTADSTVLTDTIPAYAGYLPGSMRIRGTPAADSISGGRIDVALGDLPYQGVTWVTFQVRIDPATPPGHAITNLVSLSYTGHTAGVGVSGLAGTSAGVVAPGRSDLAATLSAAPAVIQGSGPVTYLATITNNGVSTEPDPRAELTLPAGATVGALPAGCTAFAQVVTCVIGPLAPGSRATVAIPATATSAAVRAFGTNVDPVPGNNSAGATVLVNLKPHAVADLAPPGTVPVLANDDDPDGPNRDLTVTITTPPAHGTAVVLTGGTIEYTPAAGWAGDDPFTYTITDAYGASDSAVVTVRTPNAPPVPADDAAAVDTGRTVIVPVTANDSDPNGDALTVTAVTDPGAGAVAVLGNAIVFSPLVTFVGTATFTYTVSDGQDTATAQLRVTVANAVPTAAGDLATVGHLGTATIRVRDNDKDINGDPLTLVSVGTPAHGTATAAGNDVVYQATDPTFAGTDTFGYTITDSHNGSASAQITVTVENAPPTAADVTTGTDYLTPRDIDVLTGASDPNTTDVLYVSGTSDPAHGSVLRDPSGRLVYTPDAGWSGTDTFTYTLNDGQGGTDTGTVTIVVANAPPTARDDVVTRPAGQPSTIEVLLNDDDPNGDPLTVGIDTPASNGLATVTAGRVDYRPVAGYAGPDTFHYTITDGRGGTSGATVTVELVNAGPTARPDTASTPADTVVTVDLTGNDDDPNGDPVTLVAWTAAAYGTVTAGPAGSVVYTPAPGFTGADTFAYTVADPHGGTDTAVVTVVVRNAPPIAVDDVFRVGEQVTTPLPVLANDRDPNTGQALSVLSAGPAAHGTVVVTGPLTVSYTPAPGFAADNFGYVLTDDLGGTDSATVTITVEPAPLPVTLPASRSPVTPGVTITTSAPVTPGATATPSATATPTPSTT